MSFYAYLSFLRQRRYTLKPRVFRPSGTPWVKNANVIYTPTGLHNVSRFCLTPLGYAPCGVLLPWVRKKQRTQGCGV